MEGNPVIDHLLGVSECARMLGVHRMTVIRWIRAGRLPAYSTRYGHLLRPQDVAEFAARRGEHIEAEAA